MIQKFCYFVLFKALGWRMIGDAPTEKKYMLVGVPDHVWPLNYFSSFFGVLPVNRRERTNFVDSAAQMYIDSDELHATIAPEGTRKFVPSLKSGYYYIAKTANVPIIVAGPNYKEKTFTFMPARPAFDTFEEDQQDVIEFCKKQCGKYPNNSFR